MQKRISCDILIVEKTGRDKQFHICKRCRVINKRILEIPYNALSDSSVNHAKTKSSLHELTISALSLSLLTRLYRLYRFISVFACYRMFCILCTKIKSIVQYILFDLCRFQRVQCEFMRFTKLLRERLSLLIYFSRFFSSFRVERFG